MSTVASQKFCVACGKPIDARAEICPHCGVRQPYISTGAGKGKNKIVAAILSFFLGFIGIHKFYLGRSTAGILYLIFSLSGIPFVLSLIDGVMLLLMSDEEFDRKYNSTP